MYKFKFCSNCGRGIEQVTYSKFVCQSCGFKQYINVNASAGALITNDKNQVLLTRRSFDPGKGLWGIPGGFLDHGETAVEGMLREVKEETGLILENYKYYGTYPGVYRHQDIDYQTLDIIFKAEFPKGGNVVLSDESTEYAFFDISNIPVDEIGNEDAKQALKDLIVDDATTDKKNIIGDWVVFLDNVFENLKSAGIDTNTFELDHIAFRATTTKSFENMCQKMMSIGKRINRSLIRDRFIDIYEFDRPIIYKERQVRYFELMAPNIGDEFSEGLEHAEFIVNEINLENFILKYPNFKWNTNALSRDVGKDIGIRFENQANVKFKTMSMGEIIRLENVI